MEGRLKMNKLLVLNDRLLLRSPDINVSFRIKIAGNFTKNDLETAMDTVSKKHPLLKATIEKDNMNNIWLVPDTGIINIQFYTPDEIRDWREWYKKTDNTPFDFFHGPLVKICVILGNNQAEIIVLGHHIIGDGIGYLNLTKDLLLALDNKLDTVLQISTVENNSENKFKRKTGVKFLTKQYAKKINDEWNKNSIVFSEKDYYSFFQEYRTKYSPNQYLTSIEGEAFSLLIETSKQNKLTVNELIASAFAVSTVECLSHKEIRLGVAVNIRNELTMDVSNCMGNYVSGIAVNVKCDAKRPFITNAKQIAGILKGKLNNPNKRYLPVNFLNELDKDLIETIVFASYGKYELPLSKKLGKMMGEGLENKGIGISNLGRHTFDNYSRFKVLELQFIGPAFPANLISVSIITVNNCLNICLSYNETEIGNEVVEKICNKAIDLMCYKINN